MSDILEKVVVIIFIGIQFLFSQIKLKKEEFVGNTYRLTFSNNGYSYSIDNKSSRISFTDIQDEGKPSSFALPHKELFIAIPSSQNPKYIFSVKNQNTINDVLPTKPKVARKINDSLVVYEENNIPDALIKTEKSQCRFNGYLWLENRYCMHFTIFPYSVNIGDRQMVELKEFTIDIELLPTIKLTKTNSHGKPLRHIDNTLYGSQWQSSPASFPVASTDSWIDYTQDYVKLGVAKDAIYRLTYSDLQSYGVPVASLNPKNLKLYCHGEEIPIYVFGEQDNLFNQNDYVEFLGRRNYGDARYREVPPFGKSYYEYLNLYSDTTIYWLNWSGNPGKRIDTTVIVRGAFADTLKYYDELVHIENNYYWDFSLDPDGEGAVRREEPFLYENKTWNEGNIGVGTRAINFNVTQLYPDKLAKAFVKLQDYSTNSSVPTATDHLLSLSINTQPTVYDSNYIVKYQQKVMQAVFNSNVLINGTNSVNINSYATPNTQNLMISDWYELEYPRQLSVTNDSLVFAYRSIAVPQRSLITISGLSASSLSMYKFDCNDSAVSKITNYIRSNDTIRFIDSVYTGLYYYLISDDKISAPVFFYKKKFVNLRSSTRKADYIAITHPYFQQVATNYLSFINQMYNVTTTLIDINDIYDEFNFGFFAPEPIRDFLKSAYSNWQEPKPKYVFLIGKATYDFYGYKTKYFGVPALNNFVPSYGNPVSDYWFTIWDTTGASIPMISIGRVPAKNIDEFQYYFAKHQKYVSKGYDDWNKQYILFSGGSSSSSSEIAECRNANETVLNSFIKPPPIGGNGISFYKTISPTTNFGPNPPYTTEFINNTIENGSIFISYIGHSGTQTWDNSIADVTQLSNIRDRNPMITDFGCSTAKHAEPNVLSFSELFIIDTKGQAISYLGNSSLGFTSTAFTFPAIFYKKILIDTSLSIGESHRLAKIDYMQQFGSTGSYRLFTLTNSIIGDPIVKLPIPEKPNFSFLNSIASYSPERPTESNDSITIKINYFNLGKVPVDSLSIFIKDEYAGTILVQRNYKVAVPLFEDTIRFTIPIKGRPGEHTVIAELDPGGYYDELYKNDNTFTYKFVVASSSIRCMAISPNANQTNGQILFLNPGIKPQQSSFSVALSLTENFTQQQLFTVPFDTFFTKFYVPQSYSNNRIWIKTKFDTTSTESLVYSFYFGTKDNYLMNDEYSMTDMQYSNTKHFHSNIFLDTAVITFSGISAGYNAGSIAVITKNGQNLTPSSNLMGHHVAVFDTTDYSLVYFNRFNVAAGGTNITDYENLLDTLSGRFLVIIAVCNDGYSNLTVKLRNNIKLLGSKYIDSLTYLYSWALIGHKGAPAGSTKEQFSRAIGNSGKVQVDTAIYVPNLLGTFETNKIGPVAEWNSIEIKKLSVPGNSVKLKVLGVTNTQQIDTINSIVVTDSVVNLSSIKATQYPVLQVIGELARTFSMSSPSVQSIGINYKSLPELGTNYQVVKSYVTENGNLKKEIGINDTILQGEKLIIKYRVYNVGGVPAKMFSVRTNSLWENNNNELIANSVVDSLKPQTYKEDSVIYNTSLGFGKRNLQIIIDPDTLIRELYKDNNFYTFPIYVKKDSTKPLYPNYFITPNNIYPLISPITTDNDSVRFSIIYGNSGAFLVDSITVSIKQIYMNATVASWNIRRKCPIDYDTVCVTIPILKRPGQHQLQVELDPLGLIIESSKLDNFASYYFNVVTTDFIILQPTSMSSTWFPKIIFLNPTNSQTTVNRLANFEMDTLENYSTAIKAQLPMMEFSTSYDISALHKLKRYFWRIKQQQNDTNWTTGSFFLGDSSAFSVGQLDSTGWKSNNYYHTRYLPSGAQIVDTKNTIKAISAGYNDGRTGSIVLNGMNIISPIFGTGHNLVNLDTMNYTIVSRKRFDLTSKSDESDSLTQFLSSVTNGSLVIDVIVDDGSNNLKQSTRDAFKSIGSKYIDQLSLRDSWAIIGRKGAMVGSVPEDYQPQTTGPALAETTLVKKEYSGTISTQQFGPISHVSSFSLAESIPVGTNVQVQFVGTCYSNTMDTLILFSGQNVWALQSQNAVGYKEGYLKFTLQTGNQISPWIRSWKLSGTPPTELVVSNQSSSINRSDVMEGEPITVSTKIFNVSSVSADSVTVQLSTDVSGIYTILQSQRFPKIQGNDSVVFSYTYSTIGKRGSHAFIFKIDPSDSLIEQTKDNNNVALPYVVHSDTVKPRLQITFDGNQINDGDFIRRQPEISIRYADNNPLVITLADTTKFIIHLNNERVFFTPGIAELVPISSPGEARINWTPTLSDGENTIQAYAKDAAGNSSDTVVLSVNVSPKFILTDVYNFPNPFIRSTNFTFNIMDPMNPDEVSIKIYTIAGRLIQEIKSTCKIGFNKIYWDGRDKDGDEIANGVYFYKIIAKSNGTTKEAIQKLAKIR